MINISLVGQTLSDGSTAWGVNVIDDDGNTIELNIIGGHQTATHFGETPCRLMNDCTIEEATIKQRRG